MKKRKIKPCPCCSNKKIIYKEEFNTGLIHFDALVRCDKCNLVMKGKTLRSAIIRWNKRPDNPSDCIFAEGNKGGDYVKIAVEERREDEDQILLEVGHCCVVSMRHSIPVSVLTGILGGFRDEGYIDLDSPIDLYNKLPWSKEYNKKLVSKIEKIDFWGNRRNIIGELNE